MILFIFWNFFKNCSIFWKKFLSLNSSPEGEIMTTHYEKKVRCSECGAENEYTCIGSTNVFGSPDLDTRPPEMQRSTTFAPIQRCPECGYCASEVSTTHPEARAVVGGKEYRDQLNDPTYPELANSFLCKAMVDRESKDFSAATWAFIHAA